MLTSVSTGTLVLGALCVLMILAGAMELVMLFRGAAEARRWRDPEALNAATIALLKSPLVPAVAVVAAPPDGSSESRAQVRRLLELHAGNAEVVAVLDGATEDELSQWVDEFQLAPSGRASAGCFPTGQVHGVYSSQERVSLLLVDKERGGRTDCLNAAVNFAQAPLIATVDLDAQLTDQALLVALQPMIADPDYTVAVCAGAPVARSPRLQARFARLASWRNWLSRCALSSWGSSIPVPGSLSLLKRNAIIRAGGFSAGPTEMIVRLQRQARTSCSGERVCFLPVQAARPLAPLSRSDARSLSRREQSESRSALHRHLGLLFRQGSLGWVAVPELLRGLYVAPLLETAVLLVAAAGIAGRWVEPAVAVLLVAAAFAFRTLVSMTGVILAEYAADSSTDAVDLLSQFVSSVPENAGYRQWRNLSALASVFRGARP